MLELSKFFTNDIAGDNQTLKPVVLITDPETDNVLFTLTQDKEDILDNNGNKLDIISSISKVSNVRLSTDYDSKKLKINRLRCTLYNYYDVNTKLSEYINNSITNKNLFLFYKSPTTNVLNTTVDIGDYDCAMVYKGEISRVEFNKDSLNILAEDKTQKKISNKKIPYMSVDRLDNVIKNNLTEQYKEDNDVVVPMTFGKVDKAPTVTYYSEEANKLNVLLDTFSTSGKHKTSKVPYMNKNDLYGNAYENYMLYVKSNNDYLILRLGWFSSLIGANYSFIENYQYNPYSRFVVYSQVNTSNQNYLFPELSQEIQENSDLQSWSYAAMNIRQPLGAVASDGSILGVDEIEVIDSSNANFSNEESLTDNGNNPKVWYREGDEITHNVSFDTGYKTYNSTTDDGSGRWIIFKMEKGASNNLYNISRNVYINGNTFLLCDWRITQSGTLTLPANADRVGWFVAPISAEILKNIDSTDSANLKMNKLLVRDDEDIDNNNPDMVDNNNPYADSPIFLLEGNSVQANSTYWGNQNPFNTNAFILRPLQGYKYGITSDSYYDPNYIKLPYSSDEENLIAVYEYFPQNWSNANYTTKLELNNFATLHNVMINDLSQEEIYASISGRKKHTYTEQIDPAIYEQQIEIIPEDIPYSYFISGQLPVNIQHSTKQCVIWTYKRLIREDFDLSWNLNNFSFSTTTTPSIYTVKTRINNFIENESWNNELSSLHTQKFGNANYPVVLKTYSLFKYVFKYYLILFKILDQLGARQSSAGYTNFKAPPIQNALDNMHQYDQNFTNCLFANEDFIEGFFVYAFEYILQQDINQTHNYQATVNWVSDWDLSDNQQGYMQVDDRATSTINITDKIAEYKQYNWNDFNIETFGDFKDNFYIYMDDLVQAFSRALLEDYQDEINRNNYIEHQESFNVTGDWFPRYEYNMNEWADSNQYVLGLGALDTDNSELDAVMQDLYEPVINIYSAELEGIAIEQLEESFSTDGKIVKPSDVVMNILTNELGYGKYDESVALGNEIEPDYNSYDMPSIEQCRLIHSDWKMGFSVHKKIDGKKLIEEILNETQSYPRFKNDGKFGLINIKNSYTRNDIDKTINTNDILSYKFSETKREDVITSCKMFYRYDYGQKNYPFNINKEINDDSLLPDYYTNQTHNYHLQDTDGHKDINLKYHSDTYTANKFLDYKLLNECNTHNLVNMKLPLKYMDLTIGDVIHIPLINNEKIFNIDYGVVDYKNTQPIYPLWIIMETNIGTTDVSIKAYQLHYLGTDGVHGFV